MSSLQTPTPDALLKLLSESWKVSPAATAVKWSRGQWRRVRHLEYLSDLIADGVMRGNARIGVSMPPQYGKSSLLSHWTPTWFLAHWPQKRVILASYEATFAGRWGRMVRDTIAANASIGVRLRPDVGAVNEWETEQGGGMVSAGREGAITGRGADLLIIDDPFKNTIEAQSPTIREQVWDFYRTVALTRLQPGGSIIVIHTRWDADDLIGRLKTIVREDEVFDWRFVDLPELAEKNDPLGRSEGEALWPGRFSSAQIAARRREQTADDIASLYQQHPNPSGRGYYFDHSAVHAFELDCRDPVETRKGGLIKIYRKPVVAAKYVFGGDVAWGEKGAYSCVTVEDFQTGETVAEIYGRPALEEIATETVKLCREYNDAYGAPERNGEGEKVCDQMVALGYGPRMFWSDHDTKKPEKPGWQTTGLNRPTALSELEERVRTRGFIPRCRDELSEMLSFVRDEKGKPVPRPGTYSDHIMARMICGQMRKYASFGDGGKLVVVASRWGQRS